MISMFIPALTIKNHRVWKWYIIWKWHLSRRSAAAPRGRHYHHSFSKKDILATVLLIDPKIQSSLFPKFSPILSKPRTPFRSMTMWLPIRRFPIHKRRSYHKSRISTPRFSLKTHLKLTKFRMHQHPFSKCIHRPRLNPLQQSIPVHALVRGREVADWEGSMNAPFHG